MKEEDINWGDIDKRRNIMLAKSDWTQLPDSGLNVNSILHWRKWRRKVRDIRQENFDTRLNALMELKTLNESQPEKEYYEENELRKTDPALLEHMELRELVISIIEEQNSLDVDPEAGPQELTLDDLDLEEGRPFAQTKLEKAYREAIKEASPPIETFQLYTERLNQAIDCLAGTGTSFPLLKSLTNAKRGVSEIATSVLKRHGATIKSYAEIEARYLESLKMLRDSDTIDGLKKALEHFHGH